MHASLFPSMISLMFTCDPFINYSETFFSKIQFCIVQRNCLFWGRGSPVHCRMWNKVLWLWPLHVSCFWTHSCTDSKTNHQWQASVFRSNDCCLAWNRGAWREISSGWEPLTRDDRFIQNDCAQVLLKLKDTLNLSKYKIQENSTLCFCLLVIYLQESPLTVNAGNRVTIIKFQIA